jgi:hypothetical protein
VFARVREGVRRGLILLVVMVMVMVIMVLVTSVKLKNLCSVAWHLDE